MKKFQVQINEKHCKACGICIGLCPKEVYQTNYLGKAVPAFQENCIGCKMCQLHCPDFCLEVGEVV